MECTLKGALLMVVVISIGFGLFIGCEKQSVCACDKWKKFLGEEVAIHAIYSGGGLVTPETDFRDRDTADNLTVSVSYSKIISIDCETLTFMVTLDREESESRGAWDEIERTILCSEIASISREGTTKVPASEHTDSQ